MKNWDIVDEVGHCSSEKDYQDAKWVCEKLKIPLVQVNFVKDYWNDVFRLFCNNATCLVVIKKHQSIKKILFSIKNLIFVCLNCSYTIESYMNRETPNPDIQCNKNIKFNKFYQFARNELQADAIATGHYACTSFGPYLEHFEENKSTEFEFGKNLLIKNDNLILFFFRCSTTSG